MERHDPRAIARARRLSRLGGALVGLLGGIFYGIYIIRNAVGTVTVTRTSAAIALGICGLAGLIAGAQLGPWLSVKPFLWLEETLDTAPPGELIGGLLGLIVALVIAALLAVLLSGLPAGIGFWISLAIAGVLVYTGVHAGMRRRLDVVGLAAHLPGRHGAAGSLGSALAGGPPPQDGRPVIVDTSVLIDGRILDVARTGFIPGRLIITSFVLEELQRIADAADTVRRSKGRRGLSVVESLKGSGDVVCEILDVDFPAIADVDARLVRLALARQATIMTNDYNLNRLASIEGVRVLNLNDLANAIKPIVSSGETMQVSIVKEGKEPHQGVAYLEDGTMVVVENGRRHIEQTVTVTVSSVLQTPAGRMIFAAATPSGEEGRSRPVRAAARPHRAASR